MPFGDAEYKTPTSWLRQKVERLFRMPSLDAMEARKDAGTAIEASHTELTAARRLTAELQRLEATIIPPNHGPLV